MGGCSSIHEQRAAELTTTAAVCRLCIKLEVDSHVAVLWQRWREQGWGRNGQVSGDNTFQSMYAGASSRPAREMWTKSPNTPSSVVT